MTIHLLLLHIFNIVFHVEDLDSAERGIAKLSVRRSVRPSVCLSVMFKYRGHICWSSWKIIFTDWQTFRPSALHTPTPLSGLGVTSVTYAAI